MPPTLAEQGISRNPDRGIVQVSDTGQVPCSGYSLCHTIYVLYILYSPGLSLSLLLGTDYESKKNKLQQELQLDYKHYVAKVRWCIWKLLLGFVSLSYLCVALCGLTIVSFPVMFFLQKKDLKASEPRPHPQGLSLPIDEKISVQVCVSVCLGGYFSVYIFVGMCPRVWHNWKQVTLHGHQSGTFSRWHDVTCSQQP